MSRFYGYLWGNRGKATRGGSKASGIHAHLRSWKNDVYISLMEGSDGKDILTIKTPYNLKTTVNGRRI